MYFVYVLVVLLSVIKFQSQDSAVSGSVAPSYQLHGASEGEAGAAAGGIPH
jgi:hypothetical protein